MSAALQSVDTNLSLADIAAAANHELALAGEAEESALRHAIKCGEWLNQARPAFERGQWIPWLRENFHAVPTTAIVYMRLARHQDKIRECTTIKQAKQITIGLEYSEFQNVGKPEARRLALDLHEDGEPASEIARSLGVARTTVVKWTDPSYERRARESNRRYVQRRKEERKAFARAEQARAARQFGGPLSEAYAQIRTALQAMQQFSDGDTSPEVRVAVSEAMAMAYKCEDRIAKAIRLSQ